MSGEQKEYFHGIRYVLTDSAQRALSNVLGQPVPIDNQGIHNLLVEAKKSKGLVEITKVDESLDGKKTCYIDVGPNGFHEAMVQTPDFRGIREAVGDPRICNPVVLARINEAQESWGNYRDRLQKAGDDQSARLDVFRTLGKPY